jgi:hypothetical protein
MTDEPRIGRPPITHTEPSVPMTVRVPMSVFDECARRALARDISVAMAAREVLVREFCSEK